MLFRRAQPQLVRIEANLEWQVTRGKGGSWIAICEPLKLTLQSPTYTELMEDIGDALDAMLKDLLSTNELERFLREHGWRPIGPLPTRPEGVRFDVPFFPVELTAANGAQRSLYQ